MERAKERTLIFTDNSGQVIRSFQWNLSEAQVIRRGDNKRLELVASTKDLERKKIPFEKLADIQSEVNLAPLFIGKIGTLQFVESIPAVLTDEKNGLVKHQEDDRLFLIILAMISVLFLCFMTILRNIPLSTAKMEAELKQQVVKIVQHKKQMEPEKTSMAKTDTESVEKKQTKKISLKKLGALSALGSLQKSNQKSGLNLGAAQVSAGPGLGGTAGSGGVQTNIYAKGIVGVALGAGGNIDGAGGYGTKGKGGGQAGYGKLSLVGASGATPLPLAAEASIAKGLDRDQIAAVINRNLGQVRFCYEQGLQGNSSLNGRVAIAFVIGGNGLVKAAEIESSTVNAKIVEECLVLRLKSWKFPLPEGGVDVKVSYPFVLRRAGQG